MIYHKNAISSQWKPLKMSLLIIWTEVTVLLKFNRNFTVYTQVLNIYYNKNPQSDRKSMQHIMRKFPKTSIYHSTALEEKKTTLAGLRDSYVHKSIYSSTRRSGFSSQYSYTSSQPSIHFSSKRFNALFWLLHQTHTGCACLHIEAPPILMKISKYFF